MARGVPSAFNRRGRRKLAPPPDRKAHVYRDLSADEEAPKPKAAPKPPPAPEPEPAPAPEPEPEPTVDNEPEVSMKNTKAELLAVADAMGLDVNEDMVKREILAAIESA